MSISNKFHFIPSQNWSKLKKKLLPLLVHRPDWLWPTDKAKSLFMLHRNQEALSLIQRQFVKTRSSRRILKLHEEYINAQNAFVEATNETQIQQWVPIDSTAPFGPTTFSKKIYISPNGEKPDFVLVLPAIFGIFSAGPNTAFRFAAEIAHYGYNIHCLSLQTPACDSKTLQLHLVNKLFIPPEVAARFRTSSLSDNTKVYLHAGDKICATASWTVSAAAQLARLVGTAPIAYFIQDFEPNFLPWSPEHAFLMESYYYDILPIINTASLAEMLVMVGNDSFSTNIFKKRRLIFTPSVDRSLFFPELTTKEKLILFIYTRFGNSEKRNMPTLALEAVSRLVNQDLLPANRWEIHCYGSPQTPPIDFGKGQISTMLPPLEMNEYAAHIRQANVVLYLVLSPHTGYMPLEAAACGVPVVTNTYLNKTASLLRGISSNILPAAPTVEAITQTLASALKQAESTLGKQPVDDIKLPPTWHDAFVPILPSVLKWLQFS